MAHVAGHAGESGSRSRRPEQRLRGRHGARPLQAHPCPCAPARRAAASCQPWPLTRAAAAPPGDPARLAACAPLLVQPLGLHSGPSAGRAPRGGRGVGVGGQGGPRAHSTACSAQWQGSLCTVAGFMGVAATPAARASQRRLWAVAVVATVDGCALGPSPVVVLRLRSHARLSQARVACASMWPCMTGT